MIPSCIAEEVASLKKRLVSVEIIELKEQCYVSAGGIRAQNPPWDRDSYDILIAVPVTYEHAGLDGFYLKQPYTFDGKEHPRVNGQVIEVAGSKWKQVSWHYADGHPWKRGLDNLETHIAHCHGFFSGRGATNAP
jgi:hypothetical protein